MSTTLACRVRRGATDLQRGVPDTRTLAHAVAAVVPGSARLVCGLARPCPGLRLAAGSGWAATHSQSLPAVQAWPGCRSTATRSALHSERADCLRRQLIGARDLIIDSAPILAWYRAAPDAAVGHAPAQHPRPLVSWLSRAYLALSRSGFPIFFLLSPSNVHDAPFARPRIIRLDAAYWGLRLTAWIHATLHAVAVIPWNPKRQKNRSCLPPTWTKEELGKRSSIERFFGRIFLFFHLQRPLCGWSAITRQVALTYAAS